VLDYTNYTMIKTYDLTRPTGFPANSSDSSKPRTSS